MKGSVWETESMKINDEFVMLCFANTVLKQPGEYRKPGDQRLFLFCLHATVLKAQGSC